MKKQFPLPQDRLVILADKDRHDIWAVEVVVPDARYAKLSGAAIRRTMAGNGQVILDTPDMPRWTRGERVLHERFGRATGALLLLGARLGGPKSTLEVSHSNAPGRFSDLQEGILRAMDFTFNQEMSEATRPARDVHNFLGGRYPRELALPM